MAWRYLNEEGRIIVPADAPINVPPYAQALSASEAGGINATTKSIEIPGK